MVFVSAISRCRPLLLTPLPGITRDAIDTTTRSLWRYRAALPFVPETPITMGEGCTPLLPRMLQGAAAYFGRLHIFG